MSSEVVAGIDAARGGWVACVVGTQDRSTVSLLHAPSLAELWNPAWAVVGIDMPIGLPRRERRRADTEARRLLGPRRSTLFATPVHATLGAGDYADALARSRAASDRGLSKQAFHLLPKIREVRHVLGEPNGHVHEVHPDTSFTVMNGGTPMAPKSTDEGRTQRSQALAAAFPSLPAALAADPDLPVVDALDAGAAAWTAVRVARGEHLLLGDDDVDPDGYPLTMAV